MNFVVQVTRGRDGVVWTVREAGGRLLATVHSSGTATWHAEPTIAGESLVEALREWSLSDQCYYDGLNESKLWDSLPRPR